MKKIILFLFVVLFISSCQKKSELIDIGAIQQLTGQMSKYGKTQVAAINAMEYVINNERKKKGIGLLNIIVDDDKLEPQEGVRIINRMITVDKIVAAIGAQGSSVTLAMAPIAEKNKVVLISGASGSPKISSAGDYIFRTCPSDVYEGEFIAKVYDKLYAGKSVAILYINNDYGIGLRDAFKSNISNKPSKILDFAFAQGNRDFRDIISKIKQEKIQVVYIIGYEEMITIFKQAKEYGLKCAWLGNNQLNDQTMIDKMGTTADGTIFPGQLYDVKKVEKSYPDFYKKYLEYSKGVDLDIFAAYAADALIVINDALMNGARTGTDIKNYLLKVKNFKGVTGNFSFNSNGDAVRELALYQIKNGKMIPYKFN
ncbi:MAG: ABC transporter substrate-binding protein [Ignavibacteriaceae bacterium]